MNLSTRPKPSLSPAAKIAALAGGALAAAQSADAAVVASLTTPLSPPGSLGFNDWDVDGDGIPDFRLRNSTSSSSTSYASITELGAARFVAPASASTNNGFAKLNPGFVVGPTLATGFKFFTAVQNGITLTTSGGIGYDASNNGWALNDTGYFGFKFDNISGTHYGWGRVNIDGDPIGSGFTVLEAYYDDTADTPVTIPEPSHVAMLALGAAGLAAWRRRRKA